MNIQEAFKYLREATDWLMHQIDYMKTEIPSVLDELMAISWKLRPLESYEDLAKYTVLKMTTRLCADSCFGLGGSSDLEDSLNHIWRIFGGDCCGEGIIYISDEEKEDKSDISLGTHLETLNITTYHFEQLERYTGALECELWDGLATKSKIEKPEMSVWVTAITRMTGELRGTPYDEDLRSDVSLDINRELQDIFGVYREIRQIEREYYEDNREEWIKKRKGELEEVE